MPINNITQTVSTIPAPPHRGVDVQTQFVIKQEDFQDHLTDTTVTELNTLKDQFNSRISEINSTATTMNGYANTASAGASTATTKAGEASTSAGEALSYRNQAETFKNNASTSATKASQWADNNYNVEVETGKYSAKHWSTVAQNATANKVDKVTSTDNAVVRFNGTTGEVQNSGVIIDDNGNIAINNPISSGNSFLSLKTAGTERASLNINDASGVLSLTAGYSGYGGQLIFNTNGSERMRIDSAGNVGIGVTPSAWNNDFKPIQFGNASVNGITGASYVSLSSNVFIDGPNDYSYSKYISTGFAARYRQENGTHQWQTAPSGTAGNAITWTDVMRLDASGNLLLTSGTGGLGYGAGAGGTVTQLTSKSTAVTLNKLSGIITTHNSALAAGETVLFQVINNLVLQTDSIIVSMGGNINVGNYNITPTFGSSGLFNLYVKNISQISLSEVVAIKFTLIRGATA